MRDQLDRFGEIDTTAELLRTIANSTSDTVVLNREDGRIANLQNSLVSQQVKFFGLSDELVSTFPSDDGLHGESSRLSTAKADVVLKSFKDQTATYHFDNHDETVALKLNGIYNVYNSAAALCLVRAILDGEADTNTLLTQLSKITPAFGRGETFMIDKKPLELVLVKNPSGFRLGLQSFNPTGYATMIAINDNYADGRDMSWLWDVKFESLRPEGVEHVSGIRAYDMALRLQYDEIPLANIHPNLAGALKQFLLDNPNRPKRIYCTYTAMLELRKHISKLVSVEKIQ